jgi:hypothetical protein
VSVAKAIAGIVVAPVGMLELATTPPTGAAMSLAVGWVLTLVGVALLASAGADAIDGGQA